MASRISTISRWRRTSGSSRLDPSEFVPLSPGRTSVARRQSGSSSLTISAVCARRARSRTYRTIGCPTNPAHRKTNASRDSGPYVAPTAFMSSRLPEMCATSITITTMQRATPEAEPINSSAGGMRWMPSPSRNWRVASASIAATTIPQYVKATIEYVAAHGWAPRSIVKLTVVDPRSMRVKVT